MSDIIVGIDPGTSGAITVMNYEGRVLEILDIPHVTAGLDNPAVKVEVNPALLHDFFIRIEQKYGKINSAFLEHAHAFPKIHASVNFSAGDTFGCVRTILAVMETATHLIPAAVWKKKFGLNRKKTDKKGAAKEIVRAYAIRRWPSIAHQLSRVKDHNRAESICIAAYGLEKP